ncbi:hypothetical protein LTR70_007082 [Exophiala xenobiotica]|uniref:Uncharacterized protein n=1 Tax=Lithohypha guttulata TaxID=1690604 RepID=A0ABR0K6K3_9EURO|nr:hypothetical protein LTR24_006283 [Lithohypha guttulata]KAK5314645.1 hypothetical protein LTR70_007082 [Exophiala xenobiotica]
MEQGCTEIDFEYHNDLDDITPTATATTDAAAPPTTSAINTSPPTKPTFPTTSPSPRPHNPSSCFPLLSLPLELQRLILTHALGGPHGYNITLENERLTMLRSRFHVYGLPPISLLLVSRHLHTHAAPIRAALFTGRLILNSVFILVPLRRQERFAWLREHTRILHFSDSSVHPERWGRYFGVLGGLRRLEIVFGGVVRVGRDKDAGVGVGVGVGFAGQGWSVQRVMGGGREVDEWLVGSLDGFRLALVDQLREGRLEVVVTQRYDLKGGMVGDEEEEIVVSPMNFPLCLFEIDIKLTENGAEVVRRRPCIQRKQFHDELPGMPAEP